MVVPRSSIEVARDEEFTLFAVTTFKKHSAEFQQKCREMKWIPRDYKYVEGGQEEERKEVERVARDERKLWGEALRLSRTGWSESVMIWIHVLTLRVFVETVLRYGLPLDFVCGLVKVSRDFRDVSGCRALIVTRRTKSLGRRLRRHWTRHSHTSEAMHSGETRKGRLQRTTQRCRRKWLPLVLVRTAEKVTIIQLMSTMSLRSYREYALFIEEHSITTPVKPVLTSNRRVYLRYVRSVYIL